MSYTYTNLRDFIAKLEEEGELKRIKTPVDPILEISEITDRVSKKIGPALLFENPKGSSHPLLINAFGSHRRMALSLGVESLEEISKRIDELLDIQGEIVEVEKRLPTLAKGSYTKQEEQSSDYKYSREVFYGLVERGQDAIEGILDIARESEHPRVYEVAGQLIKTVSETIRLQ